MLVSCPICVGSGPSGILRVSINVTLALTHSLTIQMVSLKFEGTREQRQPPKFTWDGTCALGVSCHACELPNLRWEGS